MPRETIATPVHATAPTLNIEVTWSRGLYGQLGLVTHDGSSFNDWVKSWESDELFDSVWTDLDEAAVDRLLKVLRRVKRQLAQAPSREKDESYAALE